MKKLFFESENVTIEMAHAACKALFLLSTKKGMMDFYNLASKLTEENKFSFIEKMEPIIRGFDSTAGIDDTTGQDIDKLFDADASLAGDMRVTVLKMTSFKIPYVI